MDIKELLAMSSTTTKASPTTKKQPETVRPKTKQQRCVVYWVDELKVSIVPLSAVCKKEDAKEGVTTGVMWGTTGPYRARIIKISDNLQVLKEIEMELGNGIAGELEDNNATESKSTRGRKLKKSRKMKENAEYEDEGEEVPVKRPKNTSEKSVKKTMQEDSARAKMNAQLQAKHAVCKSFFDNVGSDSMQHEERVDLEVSEKVDVTCDTVEPEHIGLEGIARAVEVANDTLFHLTDSPNYHNMDGDSSTLSNLIDDNIKLVQKNNELDERCQSITTENERLKDEVMELKEKLADLTNSFKIENDALREEISGYKRKLEGSNTRQNFTMSDAGLRVTPRKVKFVKELASFVESSLHGSRGLPPPHQSSSQLSSSSLPSTGPTPSSSSPGPLPGPVSSSPSSCGPSSSANPPPAPDSALRTHEIMEKDDLVELVKGTGVFVTVQQRTSVILKGKKGASFMFRKLLGEVFTQEELRNGCAVGGRKAAVNKLPGSLPSIPLDSKKLDAAKAFVLCYCKRNGMPIPADKDLNAVVNCKCVEVRREFRRANKTLDTAKESN